MHKVNYNYLFLGLVFMFLLNITPVEAQCAMCRAVLESEQDQSAAKGINNGILYLMIIPYVLVGLVGFFIYKSKKKNHTSD